MTTVTVSAVTHDDIGDLVTSVDALFKEDGGQHDATVNLMWPAREGAARPGPVQGLLALSHRI